MNPTLATWEDERENIAREIQDVEVGDLTTDEIAELGREHGTK